MRATNEVSVLIPDAGQAHTTEPLCRHTPCLVFREEDFAKAPPELPIITLPSPPRTFDGKGGLLGLVALENREVRIGGASPESLQVRPGSGKDGFERVADLHEVAECGRIERGAFLPVLPPRLKPLVLSRVFLTSGTLRVTRLSEDDWAFASEDSQVLPYRGKRYAQEVEYRCSEESPNQRVWIEISETGGEQQLWRLELKSRSVVMISNLCPPSTPVRPLHGASGERDFLAYYPLALNPPAVPKIPHRVVDSKGQLKVRVGQTACPPATMFVEPG
ncbi:MAG TPA: hypothetical protein VF017_09065 [Thermoanaerobaculia bacterium]|nr:hypothetical protein [Thermoanaerobaculia bacterium]